MDLNVRDTLRQETAKKHRVLESKMNLMQPNINLDSYKSLLQKFHAFYKSIERSFPSLGNSIDELELESRKKTPLLESDLAALRIAEIKNSPSVTPRMETKAAFLGTLYVLEGSTLGGQMLFKHFSQMLPVSPDNGGKFYFCYGPLTGKMWQKFVQILEREITTEEQLAEAVFAANSTFDCLGQWMSDEQNAV